MLAKKEEIHCPVTDAVTGESHIAIFLLVNKKEFAPTFMTGTTFRPRYSEDLSLCSCNSEGYNFLIGISLIGLGSKGWWRDAVVEEEAW